MERIANKNAAQYVYNLEPFQGNNLYAIDYNPETYVVFSYGEHWPLYIIRRSNPNVILENNDKYSSTTSKHKTQARPSGGPYDRRSMTIMRLGAGKNIQYIPFNTRELRGLLTGCA